MRTRMMRGSHKSESDGPPYVRACTLTAEQLLRALLSLAPSRRLQLLDSCGTRGTGARHLIAGFDPFETVEAYGDEAVIRTGDAAPARIERAHVLDLLDRALARRVMRAAGGSPVAGACVASFAYDLVRQLDGPRRMRVRASEREEPLAFLSYFDTLVVHDYASGSTSAVSSVSAARCAEVVETLQQAAAATACASAAADDSAQHAAAPGHTPLGHTLARPVSNFTRGEYLAAVRRIKEHINEGDIYQANLTQRITCRLSQGLGPEEIFLRLRRAHPASFAALLRRPADTVVSASPERFLRVTNEPEGVRRVEAWPIKGTRRRGSTLAEDERLRAELLSSEKERAENTMIVDLMRNDLGRVCRYGSVEVTELCALEEHPTLFHLVSKVRGRLRDEVTAGDLLRAAFPCGSITGAPKIRAMEIIDETETVARGLSMGAIGYFSFDGSIDLSVAIRTMTVRDGEARFNVGGGIVADSDPAAEYDESLLKAAALLRALDAEQFVDG